MAVPGRCRIDELFHSLTLCDIELFAWFFQASDQLLLNLIFFGETDS